MTIFKTWQSKTPSTLHTTQRLGIKKYETWVIPLTCLYIDS